MAEVISGIRLGSKTAAALAAQNPLLLLGQPAIETDTRKIKIGDGSTLYNALLYANVTPEELTAALATIDLSAYSTTAEMDAAIAAAVAAIDLTGKADKDISINTQTASYTLALTDRSGLVRMNVASANVLTVPPNSSVAFPIGTQIVLAQSGAGQTTIAAGSGVTVNSSGSKMKLAGQYSGATLIKVATDTWLLMGDLVA